MYYVIQVSPGAEDKTETMIRELVADNMYGRCFHPLRHVRKKFHGEWVDQHEKLLPGYVFITSGNIRELSQTLKRVPVLTKVLGRDEEQFIPLSSDEVEWLEQITGQTSNAGESENGVECEAGLSQVLAEEDAITVLSGPLKNMEGKIKKINLHKRIAEVEVEFMGRSTVIYLGVEMVGRTNEQVN